MFTFSSRKNGRGVSHDALHKSSCHYTVLLPCGCCCCWLGTHNNTYLWFVFSVPTPTPRYSICTFFLKSSGGGGGGRYREIKKKKKYLGMFDRDVMMFTFVLYIAWLRLSATSKKKEKLIPSRSSSIIAFFYLTQDKKTIEEEPK